MHLGPVYGANLAMGKKAIFISREKEIKQTGLMHSHTLPYIHCPMCLVHTVKNAVREGVDRIILVQVFLPNKSRENVFMHKTNSC